jgi:RNA polymerase sigma factor (sigma-70 family)
MSDEDARDLAQSAWVRVLRARRSLDPDGNFPAYLSMVATNLWRDGHRSARRAGAMAPHRMASLDAPLAGGASAPATLGDVLPDPRTLSHEEQALLIVEIDAAFARLTPRLRDVLMARHLHGEPAAEIAKRHGRTEQSISAWVRQAIGEMQRYLGSSRHAQHEDRP